MLPITKKYYPLDLMDLQTCYRNYLLRLNLSNLDIIANKYSTVDAIIVSACTMNLPLEYKNRDSISVAAYNSCMIEQQKYNSLINIKQLLGARCSLYVVEYKEVVLIYCLTGNERWLKWEVMPVNGEQKEVCLMPYNKVSYCISKRTRQLRTVDHLLQYIKNKQERSYNLMLNSVE